MTQSPTELNNIIELKNIWKSFKKNEEQDLLVLDNINFTLKENEIVALLGKSGSGKSTLLRIIAGLIKPSGGHVLYRNKKVYSPTQGIAMVFQHFALMPWLTVLQNVELGLEALGVKPKERRNRALKAIDTIGLDGFESAFPRELSGGMRQRVGLARALVIDPDVLLMDEPFSALDVLTAENLRTDLIDLWENKQTQIKNILLVTHSIEEAALMADRIIIFNSDPGKILYEIKINSPHPRGDNEALLNQDINKIYTLMTTTLSSTSPHKPTAQRILSLGYRLPNVEVSEVMGLIETIANQSDPEENNLQTLADDLHLDLDDLFPLIELVDILHFATIQQGRILPTTKGIAFADADILKKKEIFSQHLISYVPLAKHIRRILDDRPQHRAKKERFLNELEDYLSHTEAERVLTTIIDWARYAEIFAYDSHSEELSLENPN